MLHLLTLTNNLLPLTNSLLLLTNSPRPLTNRLLPLMSRLRSPTSKPRPVTLSVLIKSGDRFPVRWCRLTVTSNTSSTSPTHTSRGQLSLKNKKKMRKKKMRRRRSPSKSAPPWGYKTTMNRHCMTKFICYNRVNYFFIFIILDLFSPFCSLVLFIHSQALLLPNPPSQFSKVRPFHPLETLRPGCRDETLPTRQDTRNRRSSP